MKHFTRRTLMERAGLTEEDRFYDADKEQKQDEEDMPGAYHDDGQPIKEADVKVIPSAAGGDIQMTVTFEKAVQYFEEAAEAMGLSVDLSDPKQQQKMAELMRDDLEDWLGNNGAQWIEDGMNYDVYDDLVPKWDK